MSGFFLRLTRSHPKWRPVYLVIIVGLAALGVFALASLLRNNQSALAQGGGGTFNSGSDGSDGALNLTTPGTYTLTLDANGDYIYNFTTITIGSGVTVTLKSPYLNAPVIWLATGTVQIDGVIDLNGEAGYPRTSLASVRTPSMPGAGGYSGGVGGRPNTTLPGLAGNGPFGGYGGTGTGGCGGGGSGGGLGGNNFLVPLLGGSGGGGEPGAYGSAGGGAGGGALEIASSTSIIISGAIQANGGAGTPSSNSGYCNSGGSGGGAGGMIHLLAPTITINGTGVLRALGGTGANGSSGLIRTEAFQLSFTGTSNPTAILGTPHTVYLPDTPPPSVRVVDVAGAAVPEVPTGSFTTPDVTINMSSTVTLNIEAKYVPLGSVVTLYVFSEDAPDQVNTSTPLTGTFALSTATVTATVPIGFSRMYVRSDWTP